MAEKLEYKTPSSTSRYNKLQVWRDETNLYFENPKYLEIPENAEDKFFAVYGQYINRIDLIAHKFYNDSKLWWVIAKANDIVDPLEIPYKTILRIPAQSTLFGRGGVIGNG